MRGREGKDSREGCSAEHPSQWTIRIQAPPENSVQLGMKSWAARRMLQGVLLPSTSSWAEMASAARQLSNFREQKLLVNEHRNGRGFTHGAQEHQSQLSAASPQDYTAVFLLIFRTVSLSLSRFQKKAS